MERPIEMEMETNTTNGSDHTVVSVRSILCGDVNHARLNELQHFFVDQFGEQPEYFVSVPGRVNLIGEHVDYAGFPVMPIAIEHSIMLAVRLLPKQNSLLDLRNIDVTKYPRFSIDLKKLSITDVAGNPDWYKYFLCGILGVREKLLENEEEIGMWVAISGNIPPAAGLSSSSALVCAAVLSSAFSQGMQLECKRLAEIAALSERFIGTQGGGMDQAIAFLAQPGHAQHIEFQPQLKATPIALPLNTHFVVANTLTQKNKAASPDFNQRVIECRLGAQLLAKCMRLDDWQQISNYKDLLDRTKNTLSALDELIDIHLSESYTQLQLAKAFDIELQQFQQRHLIKSTGNVTEFKLRARAHHVIRESMRVQQFRSICEMLPSEADHPEESPMQIKRLGRLMRDSHASLKKLYECSHENLDRLVQLSDEFGVHARLTGAGWGGCIIAICDSRRQALDYIAFLKNAYYSHLPECVQNEYDANHFENIIFMTKPSKSAEVLLNTP